MATLQPSRNFEGAGSAQLFKLIKPGVNDISFKDDKNAGGNYFFILPPYKLDRLKNGVSWRSVDVRVDFGIEQFKERFIQGPDCPVAFLEKQAKLLFPPYAKIFEEESGNGQKRKKYPTYGRRQSQLVFNVAYFKDLAAGPHVLHLPWFNAGQVIEEWSRGRTPEGSPNPMVNDPANSFPVWVQLKKDAVGNPWMVTINASKGHALPDSLTDSNNLYDLDDVLFIPDKELLVEKLRAVTPADIFDACMKGYLRKISPVQVQGADLPPPPERRLAPPLPPDDIPMEHVPQTVAPRFRPPVSQVQQAPPIAEFEEPARAQTGQPTATMSRDMARAHLAPRI